MFVFEDRLANFFLLGKVIEDARDFCTRPTASELLEADDFNRFTTGGGSGANSVFCKRTLH